MILPSYYGFDFTQDNLHSAELGCAIPDKHCFFIQQEDDNPIQFGIYTWSECSNSSGCFAEIDVFNISFSIDYEYEWDDSFLLEYWFALGCLITMIIFISLNFLHQLNLTKKCFVCCPDWLYGAFFNLMYHDPANDNDSENNDSDDELSENTDAMEYNSVDKKTKCSAQYHFIFYIWKCSCTKVDQFTS